ncbi:hypothetical protein AKO1_002674 [Acrasis kona]|uniref:Tudor-knot domain-containing protein n=1 Tax=Acrasis kona TaxID=1008807 RepID=A0AAW2ZNF7_9EUKA
MNDLTLPTGHSRALLSCVQTLYSTGKSEPAYFDALIELTGDQNPIYITRGIVEARFPAFAKSLTPLKSEGVVKLGSNSSLSPKAFRQVIEFCFTGLISSTEFDVVEGVRKYALEQHNGELLDLCDEKLRTIDRNPPNTAEKTRKSTPLKGMSLSDTSSVVPNTPSSLLNKSKKSKPDKPASPTVQQTPPPISSNPPIAEDTQKVNSVTVENKENPTENFIEFSTGEKIFCRYGNRLYPAKILDIRSTPNGDQCKIHYYRFTGYDEWVEMTRMYKDTPEARKLKEEMNKLPDVVDPSEEKDEENKEEQQDEGLDRRGKRRKGDESPRRSKRRRTKL